jgi:hypothetical protein
MWLCRTVQLAIWILVLGSLYLLNLDFSGNYVQAKGFVYSVSLSFSSNTYMEPISLFGRLGFGATCFTTAALTQWLPPRNSVYITHDNI